MFPRYVVCMDEARDVLARLDRIERLEREGAPADALLAQLRLLVAEAERWLRAEPAAPAAAAAAVEATVLVLAGAGAERRLIETPR
jgi:hypothetical protein